MKALRNIDDVHDVVRKITKNYGELPPDAQDAILWHIKGAEMTYNREMMRLRLAQKGDK